jgi:hypothetical protein
MKMASFPLFLLLAVGSTEARLLHLDAESGNDSADGLTPVTAWKTLAKANVFAYQPGDSLLFRRGGRWTGQFAPTSGEGTAQSPVYVGAYGEGPRPLIEGEGQVQDAVLLQNRSYWILTSLEITNLGASRPSGSGNIRRTGVHVVANNFGVMRGIRLRDLLVRDVNGSLVKHNTNEGHGILFAATGNQNISRFDDIIIEDCRLERTDRNGISQYRSNSNPRSTGVIIRRNHLEDVGGDGIKIWGSNGALVEHNVVRGGRMRAQDHAAGIWPFDANGTVIQFNEVSGMKGTLDGQAFDADYLCDSTVIQYNYSFDNDGGFLLLCAPGTSYSRNTIVRYNISVGDGVNTARVIQLGGKITNSRIYNNTFFIRPTQNVPLIASNSWDGGNADSTFFWNNIFHVAPGGRVTYVWDLSTRNFLDRNAYYGNHVGRPSQDTRAILNLDTPFENGGATGFGLDAAGAHRLMRADSLLASGRVIANNGGRDFFGNALPLGDPYVGAHQFSGPTLVRMHRIPPPSRGQAFRRVDARGALVPPSARPALPSFAVPE